jgi:hypothetical protein
VNTARVFEYSRLNLESCLSRKSIPRIMIL